MIWSKGDNNTARAADIVGSELRRDLAATSGYPNGSVFLNYARGDEALEQIYGIDKLPRLVTLKRIWDPSNIFGYNNALPTVRS